MSNEAFWEGGWECPKCGDEFTEDQRWSIRYHKYNRHNLDTDSYIERYRQIRKEIPEKYRDLYEEITGTGKAPRGFQAAVCYIESPVTQETAAETFDMSAATVRTITREIVRNGVVSLDYVQENSPQDGKGQFHGDGEQCGGAEITTEL